MDGAGATCANQALELIATTEQRWHDLGSIVERDSISDAAPGWTVRGLCWGFGLAFFITGCRS